MNSLRKLIYDDRMTTELAQGSEPIQRKSNGLDEEESHAGDKTKGRESLKSSSFPKFGPII